MTPIERFSAACDELDAASVAQSRNPTPETFRAWIAAHDKAGKARADMYDALCPHHSVFQPLGN